MRQDGAASSPNDNPFMDSPPGANNASHMDDANQFKLQDNNAAADHDLEENPFGDDLGDIDLDLNRNQSF